MGLGRRTFAAGEVLTSSNVMNYLMDQSVMNFADSTARGSAIGTAVSEGMVSYLNNTDSLEVYQAIGTAAPGWQPVAFANNVPTLSGVALVPVIPSSVSVTAGTGTYSSSSGIVTFTNSPAIRVEGVFSSKFLKYRIVVNITSSAQNTDLAIRMRQSSTDTITSYFQGGEFTTFVGTSTSYSFSNTSVMYLSNISTDANRTTIYSLDIAYPNSATGTTWTGSGYGNRGGVGPTAYYSSGILTDTTVYTGFTLLATGGQNITGNIQIMGYNQ